MRYLQPDHCTRCETALADGASIHFVRQRVIWRVIGRGEDAVTLHAPQLAPVCESCVSPFDAPRPISRPCASCRRPMFGPAGWKASVCSKRCEQRARRARAVTAQDAVRCVSCGSAFVPRRADARFCTDACRQKAYRARLTTPTRAP